jgi:hypothetical protein
VGKKEKKSYWKKPSATRKHYALASLKLSWSNGVGYFAVNLAAIGYGIPLLAIVYPYNLNRVVQLKLTK